VTKTKPATIPILTYLLIFVGVVFLINTSQIYSRNVYGKPYQIAILQLGWVFVGSLAFLFFYKRDYSKIGGLAYLLFGISLVLLIVLAVAGLAPCSLELPFAPCIKGARRWLYLNPSPLPPLPFLGVIGFQPSELMKLSLVLYLSHQMLALMKRKRDSFMVYIIITALVSLLIVMQPNMSTAVMIFAIGSVVYYASGESLKKVIYALPFAVAAIVLFMTMFSYRLARVQSFLSGEGEEDYHVRQILISLGSGGFSGVGFGQSKQKYNYLPEVASDSIFAVVGEEFGLVGTLLVVFGFGYLLYKGFKVAMDCSDPLGKMLASGITFWIGIQFFVNVAAMVKLIPLTGVPLPLMSYGGSSMVFTMMGLGILSNIESQG
jgi:cell division protein FtsW